MNVILITVIYSFLYVLSSASHYRGGFITWKPQYPHIRNQNPVAIILKQRHVWNLHSVPCNDTMIANQTSIGNGIVNCISIACYNINVLAPVAAPCVAYSVKNDWSAGEISTVVNILANITFEAAFQGNAWVSDLGVGADGSWSVSTGITTIPRSDGTYNTPPSSSMSSIKFLYVGSTYTWKIPVADTDGDIVRCRWARKGPPDECAAVCNGFPGSTLDNHLCTMTYKAEKAGSWVVALKIEDFEFSSQTTSLSSTSVQFIVIVLSNTAGCATPPFYNGKQPADACISVDLGTTVNELAQFSVGCPENTIIEVETYKPSEMTVSTLKRNPTQPSLYTMNITWTPTSIHLGVNLVCYTPLDSSNRQGNQICMKYFVNDNDPKFARSMYINESMMPVGQVYPNQSVWHIKYSTEVRRPSLDAYIYFYSKSTNQQVHRINVRSNLKDVIYSDNKLTLFTSITWDLNEQYYILFDRSIVTDPSVCGPQSLPIVDPNYWTFVVSNTITKISTTVTSTRTSTIKMKAANQTCFPPEITLIPSTSSLLSPLQFRRSDDFYISSHILLECNDSLSIVSKWTIKNCTWNCSQAMEINSTIITTLSELLIPARTLPYGIYQFKLTVTMSSSSSLVLSALAYVEIIRSNIRANLVQFGTSMITSGHEDDLILSPGTYSIDPDQWTFHASDWTYEYYCQIDALRAVQKLLISIDHLNSSCFERNQISWRYEGESNSRKSILRIYSNSLLVNRSYQFLVHMINRRNSSIQSKGYLIVNVEDSRRYQIAITCIVSKMCNPNSEYQSLIPTAQVELSSNCVSDCTTISNIRWNVYQGSNSSLNSMKWTAFNPINLYENTWFFGRYTKKFTVTNQLFTIYPAIHYWRFEVVYSFLSTTSSSSLNFVLNRPPRNGSCSIDPPNGTTSTLFNLSCRDWFDEHQIKDYSLYVWTTDPSRPLMIAFSAIANFQVRLPAGQARTFILNLVIYIRDQFDCIAEWKISSVVVQSDEEEISRFINSVQGPVAERNSHSIVRLLASGNQNTVAQLIVLLSEELNRMSVQKFDNAISNRVFATDFLVAPLGSPRLHKFYQQEHFSSNKSILNEYNQLVNTYATIRDFLITYLTNLAIFGLNSIQLQASALVQLTLITNQLTRTASILAAQRCYQFTEVLHSSAAENPLEDIQSTATLIAQCISNMNTAIDGPLQKRTSILDLDFSHARSVPPDYNSYMESKWADMNLFADAEDFLWEITGQGRSLHYQKEISDQINNQATEIIAFLTSALNLHLNLGQNTTINTSSIFLMLKRTSFESLSNRSFEQTENSHIYIPFKLTSNIVNDTKMSVRSVIQPLASADKSQSNTNLSRSVSFSILDDDNHELAIQTTFDHPIELIIPRDPNLIVPEMILQNVTSRNNSSREQLFHFNYINIKSVLAISVHFEIRPLKKNLAYLFIYKFDHLSSIDGWKIFCPTSLTKDNLYTYFIDNQRTVGHQSVIYGIRELNSTEMKYICSNRSILDLPVTPGRFSFTSDYEIRIYLSGCYYLDLNKNWQSDGLLVGPLTNHYQTHCYSTHLTTFAAGFRVLSQSIDWNSFLLLDSNDQYSCAICVCANSLEYMKKK